MRRMLALVGLLVAGIISLAEPSAAQRAAERAQRALPDNEAVLAERMNANTVTVISGTPGGTYFRGATWRSCSTTATTFASCRLGKGGGTERV